MLKRFLVILLSFTLFSSCAIAPVAPVGDGSSFVPADDELRLWKMADKEIKKLDGSGHLYDDPELTAYLNSIAKRLAPPGVVENGLDFDIKIIANPLSNAFALPNGTLYVHTGVLARMENEAQLATLLAHEMIHTTHRHAIQRLRNTKKKSSAFSVAVAVGTLSGMALPIIVLGAIGTMAAVSGYSKDKEREADREGLALLIKAGYDPSEAPVFFEHLRDALKDQKEKEPFFFGTHPRVIERIKSYRELLKTEYKDVNGDKGYEGFAGRIAPLLLDNAAIDLSVARHLPARKAVERYMDIRPGNARAHYLLGEALRLRNEDGDKERSKEEYKRAATLSPIYAEPHKMLGLLCYREGDKLGAIKEFKKYLALAPAAEDKGYIEGYLKELVTAKKEEEGEGL